MCWRDSQLHDLARFEMDIAKIPKSTDNQVSKKASDVEAFFFFYPSRKTDHKEKRKKESKAIGGRGKQSKEERNK